MSRFTLSKLAGKISAHLAPIQRRWNVARNTRHVSGPRKICLHEDEVVLVCLLKDAEYYLQHFIDHHRAIGVKHFLLIDNGSTDKTRNLVAADPTITVYSNALPVRTYECLLRARIARRAVTGGWFLFADSDELMVFSRGEGRHISEIIGYCNAHGYEAVIGQVLDMFSPHSLKETSDWSYPKSVEAFDLYSLNSISHFDYRNTTHIEFQWDMRDNTVSNERIKFMFGGIRNEVFGENCCLTTHRLVRNANHIELYTHPHCSNKVACADFTFLVKHYKFAGNFWAREQAQVDKPDWEHDENRKRMSILQGHEDFVISGKEHHVFRDTEDLILSGFLECSARYLEQFPRQDDTTISKPPHA